MASGSHAATQPRLIRVPKSGFHHQMANHFAAMRKGIGMPESMSKEPPLNLPHDCEEDGHCWKFIGESDGDKFYKCRYCNQECEQ